MIIQKIIGIIMIVISIIGLRAGYFYDASINSNDATFLLLIIPISLYLIFTKNKYINK